MQITEIAARVLDERAFVGRVYWWMAVALCLTAVVAMWTASTPALQQIILGNQIVFFGLILSELALVFYLSFRIAKMSVQAASVAFVVYSLLNGLTLSIIFLAFTAGSLASTFFVTAGTFGFMSAYGYFTKTDLTRIGNICFMALIGLILATVVNIFWNNSALYWITTYVGVLIFVGLTAYDTQKIKRIGQMVDEGSDEGKKAAVMGALALYLDFINLFLMLLRIFGRRR